MRYSTTTTRGALLDLHTELDTPRTPPATRPRCPILLQRAHAFQRRASLAKLEIVVAIFAAVCLVAFMTPKDDTGVRIALDDFYSRPMLPSTVVSLYEMARCWIGIISIAISSVVVLCFVVWRRGFLGSHELLIPARQYVVVKFFSNFLLWILFFYIFSVLGKVIDHTQGDPVKMEAIFQLWRSGILFDSLMTSSFIVAVLPAYLIGLADSVTCTIAALVVFLYTMGLLYGTVLRIFIAASSMNAQGLLYRCKATHIEGYEKIQSRTAMASIMLNIVMFAYVAVAYHGVDAHYRPIMLYVKIALAVHGIEVCRRFLEWALQPRPPAFDDHVDCSEFDADLFAGVDFR
ncbi:hypothetical protein Pelo_2520 [Pelomyxa schiedti]|nr:hypothetical protein Pelo_2520 [Pelomyxa schiedti]